MDDRQVQLRLPALSDETEVRQAQVELAEDDFEFFFLQPEESWEGFVNRTRLNSWGRDLPQGWVPNSFLLAEANGAIVGRVSIRHELNDALLQEGGHIGYGVRPAFRRRGYGLSILEQSLELTRGLGLQRVLITCDDDNVASIKLIESCGGILENVTATEAHPALRRYWIELGVAR